MITVVLDCTGSNLGKFKLPAGAIYAGYDTGSPGIAWTKAQFAAYPGTVHIDQDAGASDFTADILDVERDAATDAEAASWYRKTLDNYQKGVRLGQRHPAFYKSASGITSLVNALKSGGITSGPGLWVANWNLNSPQAIADVNSASGPFPVIGVQWANQGLDDTSVFSTAWLNAVSKAPQKTPPPPAGSYPRPVPPGTTGQAHWAWCRKCQGLFYFPGTAASACPAGGKHDGSHSWPYTLPVK